MSSLIFYATPEWALVVTDTLAVSPHDDFTPAFFTMKAHYVPHLRMIIAGTGVAGFSSAWFDHVSRSMLVRGIENLDYFAPEKLRQQWEEAKEEFSLPDDQTTTVYHIGYSEETDEITVIAYRSGDEFESQRITSHPNVFAAKPDCSFSEDGDIYAAIKMMMEEQRSLESAKPPDERVHIGGEAVAMHLTKQGCNIFTLFRFPDFEEQMQQAFENHTQQHEE